MKYRIPRDFVAYFCLDLYEINTWSNSPLYVARKAPISQPNFDFRWHIRPLYQGSVISLSRCVLRNQYCLFFDKVQYKFDQPSFSRIFDNDFLNGFRLQTFSFKIFLHCLLWKENEFLLPLCFDPETSFMHVYEYTPYKLEWTQVSFIRKADDIEAPAFPIVSVWRVSNP